MSFIKKISTLVATLLFLALLSFLTPQLLLAAGEQNSPQEDALKLQKLYGGLTSLSFDFQQVARSGGRERTGSGNAVFVKISEQDQAVPGKSNTTSIMRWNYTEPDMQVIINDGHTLLIYTEKDKQMIKTSSKELESDITFAFFAGTRDLLDDFDAKPGKNGFIFSSARQLKTIRLVPRQPHNQIKSVQIWFDNDSVIRHLMIEDHFESITELNFENIAINSIPDVNREKMKKITTFPVPPDTEIITQ